MKLSLLPNLSVNNYLPTRLVLADSAQVSIEPEASVNDDSFEPKNIDWRITVPATGAVVIFALVIIIFCCLKKGRSDGFGAPRS